MPRTPSLKNLNESFSSKSFAHVSFNPPREDWTTEQTEKWFYRKDKSLHQVIKWLSILKGVNEID